MRTRTGRWIRASGLAGALAAAAAAPAGTLPAEAGGQPVASLAPMLERVTPAVVNIATRGKVVLRESPLMRDPLFQFFFNFPNRPRERMTQSLGSGVVVDPDRGYILTNHHVIENAHEIQVTLRDGRVYDARLIGADPDTDVAVVKVRAENLTAVALADSDALRVGDFVVAIGNPFGLGQTVTSGIVSALGRSGLGIEGYEDFIQTDAAINVGSSGGALVNLRGELVGINTAILAPGGGNIGIGFAIPINMARNIMGHLVTHGEVRRGLLGVATQDLTPALADAFDIPATQGALVAEVLPSSPAAEAGLQPGDVITAINDRPVDGSADVANTIGQMRVGESVRIDVLRDGRRMRMSAPLADRREATVAASSLHRRLEGAVLGEIPAGSPLHGRVEGVLVTEVLHPSPAWALGLRPGDVITGLNKVRVTGVEEFERMVNQAGSLLMLNVVRGNGSLFILVQ